MFHYGLSFLDCGGVVTGGLASLPGTGSGGQRERGIATGEVADAGELPPRDDERRVVLDQVAELPGILGRLTAPEVAALPADRAERGRVPPRLRREVTTNPRQR